jgi:hypothetical protein
MLTVMVLLASVAVFSWKYLGFLIPERVLSHPRIAHIASLVTIALLSALLAVQAVGSGQKVVFDERLAALLVAAVLLRFKAPYLLVVISAAIVAAALRFLSQSL